MLVTLLPMVTLVRPEHKRNARSAPDTIGYPDIGQTAPSEHIVPDAGNAFWNRSISQATPIKRRFPDIGDTVGNHDAGQDTT